MLLLPGNPDSVINSDIHFAERKNAPEGRVENGRIDGDWQSWGCFPSVPVRFRIRAVCAAANLPTFDQLPEWVAVKAD